jgi:hypothetical protein
MKSMKLLTIPAALLLLVSSGAAFAASAQIAITATNNTTTTVSPSVRVMRVRSILRLYRFLQVRVNPILIPVSET